MNVIFISLYFTVVFILLFVVPEYFDVVSLLDPINLLSKLDLPTFEAPSTQTLTCFLPHMSFILCNIPFIPSFVLDETKQKL